TQPVLVDVVVLEVEAQARNGRVSGRRVGAERAAAGGAGPGLQRRAGCQNTCQRPKRQAIESARHVYVPVRRGEPVCRTCETASRAPSKMGARRRRRSASGEAGWTARLLDANEPDVEVERLGEDEDRLRSGDGNRQDS